MSTKVQLLASEEIKELHEVAVELFGGTFGVRDENVLEVTAMSAAVATGGLFVRAATYAYYIARHQPFYELNETTAILVALVFLGLNGVEVPAEAQQRLEPVPKEIQSGKLDLATVAEILEGAASDAH